MIEAGDELGVRVAVAVLVPVDVADLVCVPVGVPLGDDEAVPPTVNDADGVAVPIGVTDMVDVDEGVAVGVVDAVSVAVGVSAIGTGTIPMYAVLAVADASSVKPAPAVEIASCDVSYRYAALPVVPDVVMYSVHTPDSARPERQRTPTEPTGFLYVNPPPKEERENEPVRLTRRYRPPVPAAVLSAPT